MQTSLNLSLVLHVYGDRIGLLADTGIFPLQLTIYVHLVQLQIRHTITRPYTLPALLFQKLHSSLPLSNLYTSTLVKTAVVPSPLQPSHLNPGLSHTIRNPCFQDRPTNRPPSSHDFTTPQKSRTCLSKYDEKNY